MTKEITAIEMAMRMYQGILVKDSVRPIKDLNFCCCGRNAILSQINGSGEIRENFESTKKLGSLRLYDGSF
jgi:hypothetical protein